MSDAPASRPRRMALVKALVVLASALAVVAIFSTWIERQALDTEEWVDTSSRLLEDERIRTEVADYAVAQLYANVNVDAELQRVLPKDFKDLSGPASSGLRELANEGALQALGTSRFQQLWRDANRAAHRTLIDIVEDRGDAVSTEGGEVELQLRPLIIEVADQLGLGKRLADQLPPDAASLRILSSDQLGLAQTIAKLIRGIALITTLFSLGLLALAIYLSRGYRWVTILGVGVGFVLAGVLVLILRAVAGDVLVRELATETAQPAAEAAWGIATSLLAEIARTVILYGVLFMVGAWLVSPHRSSLATRRAIAPVLRDYPAAIGAVLGVAGMVWVLAAIGSTRQILFRLFFVVLAAVGLFALRRRCDEEFPEATLGELPARMRARAAAAWTKRGRAQPPEPEPEDRRLERLERLATLHERGALSDEEFAAQKAELLAGTRQ